VTPTLQHPPDLLQQIRAALEILKLPEMHKALLAALESPTPGDDRLAWLWRLLEPQLHRRIEGRFERRLHESRLPARKTLAEFDFPFQPGLDRDLIMELATLRFVKQGKNLLLAGFSGTGKSHIGMALCLNGCAENLRVLYTTSASMLAELNASLADGTLEEALKPYVNADLLMIDEVGMEQVERKDAYRSGLMQKVLLPRYNEQRSSIVTSNIDWEAWGDYLDDHLGATALIDRLLHHSHVIVIKGPSWRDHVHQQEVNAASKSVKAERK
jgi:DNA replication protein DnaC